MEVYITYKKNFNFILIKNIFRMGTSQRDDSLKKAIRENFPGPGNYKINSDLRESTPSYKFGCQSRDRKNTNITPGPGQYHIPYTMMDVPRYLSTGGGFNDQFRYI